MSQHKAYDYEALAEKAHDMGDYVAAEKYYLLAAQELATSNVQQDVKNRTKWDRAAKRARRLAQLGGSGS